MGDVAFRAVVNDLYQRLVSKVIKELALLWGLEDNISNLRNDFDQIKADLEDAEETPMIIKEKAQELCLKRLRSALLMIENLLQDISAEALLCRLYKERGIIDRVRTLFCCKHNQLMFRFRIVHRIKAIRRKLEDLDYKRSFNTPRKTTHIDMGFEGHMPDRETSSRMHDSSIIFGRNEEAEMMKRKPATHQSKNLRKVLTRRAITRETYRKTLGKEPGKRAIKGRYKRIKERGEDRPTTYKTHIKESIRFQRRGDGPYARKEDQNSLRFSLVFHYLFVILCKRHSPGNSSDNLVSPKKIGVYNAPN
ncbi:hypothetical protein E3N88_09398 [Mikania micrantha]|uniref:Disease resistance N-terminal domain-containing protein n=1 Tax=Mikania micrantha TaxID=192012 RepID=A0A5N6PJM3_9ASTR|nr:hypothetical protein E3N88_09398 [Mikania micrantha]